MTNDPETLIDRIYEAAMVPETWVEVLDRIAGISGSVGAVLMVSDSRRVGRWIASDCIEATMREWVEGNWPAVTKRTSAMLALRHPGFVREIDLFTDEDIESDRSVSDFLRPRGLGRGAGAYMTLPTGEAAVFSIERRWEAGPIDSDELGRLDALRPHLARSALMAARLGLERVRGALAALDILGLPAALMRADGRVLHANDSLASLPGQVIAGAHGTLALASPSATALLRTALSAQPAARVTQSIPVPATPEAPPLVLHILPLCGSARDIFLGGHCLLVATPVAMAGAPDMALLQGLFDLTPAEARLAGALLAGETIESQAAKTGLSPHTLRTQLKLVFAKTGTRRQADLVRLLGGAVPLPGDRSGRKI